MSTMETAEAARGRWPGILTALGIDAKYLRNVHGPCPACGGKDRFRFDDDLNGKFFCSQCGAGDGFVLLQRVHAWDFKKAASEVDRIVGNIPITTEKKPERSDEDKSKACRKLLEGAGNVVDGTAAYRYLLNRCGHPGEVLRDLRAHPGIRHTQSGGVHPAMLGIMRYADGSGASVHRTYLTQEGQKALVDPVRKMMPGLPLNGSAVRLGSSAECMGIAEGIETAITASKLFDLPVWAATCAGLMKTWEPPAGVRSVVIFADNDENFVGYDAAMDLGKRLRRLGLEWEIKMPEKIGSDWNDAQTERVA
jgi:putative DNA primase/helicase